MWRKGSNNYAKTFFSIYFPFLFLTSFHLVGSKSWDSFILLSMKVPIQMSQFWGGGGGGLHRNRSHHGLLTVRSQTTGILWHLYSIFDRKVGNAFPALSFDCLVLCSIFSYSNFRNPYPYIYIQPEKVGKRVSLE